MSHSGSGPLLGATSVSCGYGRTPVLQGVSVELHAGEIVAIVGPNGAGKTTLLRALSGELPLATGIVSLHGQDVTGLGVRHRLRRGMVHVPEHRHLFPNLSVRENLILGAAARTRRHHHDDISLAELIDRVVDLFPVIGERLRLSAGTLSGGQQQMLAIGRGLMSRPDVILVDEPSLGLAPTVVDRLLGAFTSLAELGAGILLVEQYVESALDVGSRGYVLRGGVVQLAGPSEVLLADTDALLAAYFGVGDEVTVS